MLLANMSFITKPNKDHSLPQNYRPISVNNNDLKIFSRILADRLVAIIPFLISPYQSGFISNHLITDNICLATNIIQDANLFPKKLLLHSLDIHKAFDSVSWQYMSLLLQRYGFQGEFLWAFQSLYHNPRTCIRIPGCSSVFFQLGRAPGRAVPCHLWFLHWQLSLLPRPSYDTQISHDMLRNLWALNFVCTVLLFLSNPTATLPNLLKVLTKFAKVSGISVNVAKSVALPINFDPSDLEAIEASFPFIWSTSSLSYLGITLPGNYKSVFNSIGQN